MKFLTIVSMMTSFFYMISSHPVLLMAFILTQTLLICAMGWLKLKISWFSYILFLIFLGGLMVLFIYITSLASNELILSPMENYKILALSGSAVMALMLLNLNITQSMSSSSSTYKTFYFMYSWNSLSLIILTMIYLLLTLIIVVKVSNKFEAPIKNMIF